MKLNPVPKDFISISQLISYKRVYVYHKIREEQTIPTPVFPLLPDFQRKHNVFPENFVFEMPMGKVFGSYGVVVTENNKLLKEAGFQWGKAIEEHTIYDRETMPEIKYVKQTVAVIAAQAPNCYYHWILEVLPRIKLLKDSKVKFDRLYVPKLKHDFQRITLEKMGFHENDLIIGGENSYVQAERLIVPSLVNYRCCINPSWAIKFLRDIFLPKETALLQQTKRLFISRRRITTQWARRYIVNYEQVWSYLSSKGFLKVILEDLDIEEQARLFNSAEIVLGTHGAGLTNLIFCRPETKVIEIFHPELLGDSYWFLSHQLNLDHHCLLTSLESLTKKQKEKGDVYIPIKMLEGIFDVLEISSFN